MCYVVRLGNRTYRSLGGKMEYVVIFEEDENGCSTYVPDLPGCIAAGYTIEEVRILIAEAIEFHIEGLQEDGEVVPLPISSLLFKENQVCRQR